MNEALRRTITVDPQGAREAADDLTEAETALLAAVRMLTGVRVAIEGRAAEVLTMWPPDGRNEAMREAQHTVMLDADPEMRVYRQQEQEHQRAVDAAMVAYHAAERRWKIELALLRAGALGGEA